METESRLVVSREWGISVTATGYELSFWGAETILKLACDGSCIILRKY